MHNLSGVFVKVEDLKTLEDQVFYPLAILYPNTNKKRVYYCEKEEDCLQWVKILTKVTGHLNFTDIYTVKVFIAIP